jgi:hypothetical protein
VATAAGCDDSSLLVRPNGKVKSTMTALHYENFFPEIHNKGSQTGVSQF